MVRSKVFNLFILIIMLFSLTVQSNSNVNAMPASPTDESKVPHYFGPYPNWSNSPFTLPDVTVTINGDGSGATAQASVGNTGEITGITVTNPGTGYTTATVEITGAGTGAAASAAITSTGVVTGITVDLPGSGYTSPSVTISGGGAGTLTQVGNPLVDRAFSTDYVIAPTVTPASVLPAASRIYHVSAGSASGGSFTLTVDAATSAAIAWNAAAADVEAALLAAGVSATVSGSGSIADPWVLTFGAAPASVAIDGAGLTQAVTDASVSPTAAAEIFNANVGSASGGTFSLGVDSVVAGPIAWNALAADVQTALEAAGISASVTGAGTSADPWVITFAVAPALVTMDSAGLTQTVGDASAAVAPTDVYHVNIGTAIGGSFTLTVDAATTAAIAWNAAAADVEAALGAAGVSATVTGSGSSADPWVLVFATAPGSVAIDGAGLTQPAAPAVVPVFVVVPTALPNGTLKAFQTWNQASTGGSPTPSAGQQFHAFVLRPTGNTDEYQVLFDSGLLTVPALANPAVSEVASFPVPDFAVQAGDVLAFYGAGIPVDTGAGSDLFYYPSAAAPAQGTTIAVNNPEFPLYGQARTYSFAASVVDMTSVAPTVNATATAYGGVDAVHLSDAGSGYTMPTVDFDLPDAPDGLQAKAHAEFDPATGAITAVVVDNPGSGYSFAPKVVIRDGTLFDPIRDGGTGAAATATLAISSITVDNFGEGYVSAPTVVINDPTGNGATASASVSAGGVTAITVSDPGSGYITQGGIKKFQDGLPVLCDPNAAGGYDGCTDNNLGQHIPIAVPDQTTFTVANGFTADTDYYVIAVVQHRERMSSSLPESGTLLREYVQLETSANAGFSKSVPLYNDLLDGTSVPAMMPDGTQAVAVDDPHFLGPVIVAQKDRAVRIVFYNLLPTGAEGDLFLPTDSTLMGSGMGPMDMMSPVDQGSVTDMVRNPDCSEYPKPDGCFVDNRATLHLHGGISPWISDGTPHQWITPANESTPWPEGVSVEAVPDMARPDLGVPDCSAENDGCMTFYYTNQQSARLMFYHDHSWGITRLNVYAGEAAGYIITDDAEKKLLDNGLIPGAADTIPLIIQDRTFVPGADQLAAQDPTWDSTRWGGYGNLWYHHVYMPAQNPGDPGGMSAYGRWMYGPWFWPPAKDAVYGPIPNPYYNMDPKTNFTTPLAVPCNIDDPSTWQYDTDPYCEPPLIPGTPNISVGMEQFNDTPIVNGTAYPTTNVEPKTYRMRILNAANDRFWNLQWYVADPRTGTDSEVALNPAELAAAQLDPVVFPTPDTSWSPAGPSWIQIGTEGGFLPAPVVVPNQPITWITDPTRFDVGNVDKHSLLLAPAERADVIVDFSKYAGKTLILYNDAPAAFPARVPSYDYYTGAPDLSPNGPAAILPGYGPNTRTIMQVKVAASTPAPAFNLSALNAAFRHHADGSGVFESGQHPIIVGQAAYNSAYGTSFASSSWCNAPGGTVTRCDGYARISDQGGDLFGFNTLRSQNAKLEIPLEPKAIHDEMNASSFDEFGRMTANLGLEAVPATPGLQNVILYPYVNPATELIDATNLPTADVQVTPIATADGTQIWKITHNGVDTHPIHFHLYDVQVLNRVTWDNIIIPPDATELGWKDTVRISPLEDTIVALRPIIPTFPFELPNSIRLLNPMMPQGSTTMFNNIDAGGNPTAAIENALVNFGWEYVYHCHILSHEEMDMMRPVSVALPPNKPDGLTYLITGTGKNARLTLSWNDNSINETEFVVQRNSGFGWIDLGSSPSPLDQANTHGTRSFIDTTFQSGVSYSYRVVAKNTVGYGGDFMALTVQSVSDPVVLGAAPNAAPTNLTATLQTGPQVRLTWRDNATNEAGFIIERATNGGAFVQIGTAPARSSTGGVTYNDTTVQFGTSYVYRVAAVNGAGALYSGTASVTLPVPPAAPSSFKATNGANNKNARTVVLTWVDNSTNETGFTIQRATNAAFTTGLTTTTVGANVKTLTVTGLSRNTRYYFRIRAVNGSVWSAWVNATPFPILTNP